MRALIVSDIHSNLQALRSVLSDAGRFDLAINAGDTVGYGPHPNECVRTVDSFKSVAGNHDYALITGDTSDFNPLAAEAVSINRRLVDGKARFWLENLPMKKKFSIEDVEVAVVHGSPRDSLNEYVFPAEAEMLAEDFLVQTGADLLVLGHTHIPYITRSNRGIIVNPGSVGQPRDGDPRASYMIADLIRGKIDVEQRRVEYDIEGVASRMGMLGLPRFLSERLFSGM